MIAAAGLRGLARGITADWSLNADASLAIDVPLVRPHRREPRPS
jgi:hypothetical protein